MPSFLKWMGEILMNVMKLKYPFDNLMQIDPSVLAIGYFDGIHIGHQEVIQTAQKIARQKGLPCGLMTFDRHPRDVLGTAKVQSFLTPLEEKLRQFEKLKLDFVILIEFDIQLSKVSPQDFVEKVLHPLRFDTIVVGFDFTFGHLGKGTSDSLKTLGKNRYTVEIVPPIKRFGDKVSSTIIRERLHEGLVHDVKGLLGRLYSIHGTVVHGEGRGKTIGFPTANIELSSSYMLPRQGVYVVKINGLDSEYYGVINIGLKPTFHEDLKEPTIEVHLLDYKGELYGQPLNIEFLTYLRKEKKFETIQLLIEQIHRDVNAAKEYVSNLNNQGLPS
jgi:riboflavin kinase/FMN adenylyltransferase